jgi:GTPase
VLNAEQGIGPGDRFIADLLRSAKVPVLVAVNKVDRVNRNRLVPLLSGAAGELDFAAQILPISARTGEGMGVLTEQLIGLLPNGPFYFDAAQHSDQSEHVRLAELVREQVLRLTREEVPHAVEVEIESIMEPHDDLIRVEAVVLVETESQKGILIGAGGKMVKAIGTGARKSIERDLQTHVHLALSVKVRRHWRGDERLLDRLGIE